MRRSSLFVGILSLLHATDLWCHCEDDEITLLQLNTRVQAETLPSVEGLRAKSALESARQMSHPGAEALLESVRHLARQATSESPEVVNTAIEAVKAALAQMQPKITDEHDLAQLQIQRQLQEIEACHSSEVHGATVVGNLVTEISTIQDCRNAVASDLEVQARDCNAWEIHTQVLPFPECVTTGSGSQVVYDRIRNLRDWANDEWITAERIRGDCLRTTEIHDDTEARCRPVIDHYDESYCQHYLSCSLLTSCHEHEVLIYSSLSTDTLVGQNSRQQQWRILIQANCILDLITGGVNTNATVGDANMSSCDDDIYVEHLTLDFPDPELWAGCGMTHSEGDPQCPEVELPGGWADGAPVLLPFVPAPVTYRYGDGRDACPTSDVSEADCLAAVQSLLPVGQSQGRTSLVTGSWGWVPPGCSVQSHFTHNQAGDWSAHYNHGNGNNDGGYTKVCTGPATQIPVTTTTTTTTILWCQDGVPEINLFAPHPFPRLLKCCAASCGACSGSGCGERPGGRNRCCHNSITSPCRDIFDTACIMPTFV